MLIETLKLRDFRNYASLTLKPHPGVNILFGQNGAGKTNLLEAIHYCALGRSHRTSMDREVVRKGCAASSVGVQLRKRSNRMDVTIKLTPDELRHKTILIDQKKTMRLSDMMGKVQCVIFSPEDLMIVKEGPSVRRRFMDMMLSQVSTSYFVALQQYQKALEQRNAMLKDLKHGARMDTAMLEAFELALAVPCETIIPMRRRIIRWTEQIAAEKYAAISGRPQEPFTMIYQCCLDSDEDITARVCRAMAQHRQEDILRGSTGFGIHREDLKLLLSGREMKVYASQGQIRTAALSMKLAQLEVFRQETGETPILLLDDVMSELDMTRRTRLLQEMNDVQTFITCTDESDLEGCLEKRSYSVVSDENGLAQIVENTAGEDYDLETGLDDLGLDDERFT